MAAIPQTESATVAAVKAARVARLANSDRDSRRLSASSWGDDCDRKLWYDFRWVLPPEKFDGRMRRLFDTGHREEERIVGDLIATGFDVAPNDPATGEQWEYSFLAGHGVAKLDGKIKGIPEAPATVHTLEVKTHNGVSYNKTVKDGVQKAKPLHYVQMQLGMHGAGLDRALYFAVNKNTDEEHSERVEYDLTFTLQQLARGERIVRSDDPPEKLHEDPTRKSAFQCGYCSKRDVCHEGAMPRRNCRTCLHATAEMDGDGRWSCARHKRDLTFADQQAGCQNHLFLPGLVPGEQVDVDPAGNWVSYRMADGTTFIDGNAP